MEKEELSPVEVRYVQLVQQAVKERAAAAKAVDEHTREIAELCIRARKDGVTIALLARCVKVWDPKRGEMRQVTRQSVDQLVSSREGRPRKRKPPRKKPTDKINLEAFA